MSTSARPRTVALLGGGVIGAGWAARFVLNGCDVSLYDPAPGAGDRAAEVVADARSAYEQLTLAALPREGELRVVDSVEEAVAEAELVQESAPERVELKRELLAAADGAAPPEALVCSSTSGLRPTELQAEMARPERFCVAHPFNPVYLLPLVELCAGSGRRRRRSSGRRRCSGRSGCTRSSCAARSTASSRTGCSRRSGARRCGS